MNFNYYSQMSPVAVRHVCVFCDTLLHNSSTPNDIIGTSLMPSGPPSFVCGVQTLRSVVFFHTRGSIETLEPVPGLERGLGTSSGTQEAWKYFFNSLLVLERHTSGHDMTSCNKSKSNLKTTTWNSFLSSITFVSHKRSMLIEARRNSEPLAIGHSSVVDEQPFEEVQWYSPQSTTPYPGWQQLDLMQILSGCCELKKHSIHSLISTNDLRDVWLYTRNIIRNEWGNQGQHNCTMTSSPAQSF